MRTLLLRSIFAWFVGLSLVASAQDNDFFPVMAWNSPPADPAVLKKMKECGLTVAGFVPPSALDLVHAAGLKAIVSDPRVSDYNWQDVDEAAARTRVSSLVAEVGKHPAVYGYYLRDEPPASFFPGLAKVAAVIHELAPSKWAYINLFPNYATPGQLGAASYEEYVEKFVAACKPTTLSYDHYALLDNGSLRAGYWQNLEQMRAASKKHGIPFWNIVLAVAHFDYREPSAADLRFQVYSTLAYGGRGISYFTYFAPQVGNYRMAPIDQFGNPTATWNHLQNVNLQISKLAPTLLRLTSDRVYHFGAVPGGCSGPTDETLVQNIGGEIAVGDFTHEDGSRYVMLVNKNVQKSIPLGPQFRKAPKKVELVSPYTGQLTGFEGEQVWVAPGQGALLKVTY
ncbi:hypothetical protein ACXR0O_23950 [Verrucomicrobiota bacterium sgz303538]